MKNEIIWNYLCLRYIEGGEVATKHQREDG